MFQQLNPSQATLLLNALPAGKRLIPREGTPLARIVRQTIEAVGLTALSTDKELSQDEIMTLILTNSKAKETHEALMVELVTTHKNQIERQLRYIRNDVRDVVESVFSKVSAALEDRLNDSVKYIVEPTTLPEAAEHPVVTDAIKRIGSGLGAKVSHGIFPALTNADLEALILANTDDEEVKAFIGSLPVEMTDIYNTVFRNQRPEVYPSPLEVVGAYRQSFEFVQNLFVVLLAEAMQAKTPPGVNASQAEFSSNLANLVRARCGKVREVTANYRSAVERGQVVERTYAKEFKTHILVNERAYTEFKEKGGTEAHVIGAAVAGSLSTVASVISNPVEKANLEKQYEAHMARLTLELNEKRSVIVAQTTALEVSKVINDNTVNLSDLGYDKTTALANMRQVMATTRFHGQEDVYQFVRSVVCRTLYKAINAEYALEGIDKYCKENEALSVREAALLVLRDLLTLWLSSQMELV